MVNIETWRSRHPGYNNRTALENIRAQCPERQVWVGDSMEQPPVEPMTQEHFFGGLLTIGHETFAGRPILPSSVLIQASADITIYGLGRSLKDPEDAAEALLKRSPLPHLVSFLQRMFALVEEAHESGASTYTFASFIGSRVPDLLGLAFSVGNQIDESVPTGQVCSMVWQRAIELSEGHSDN